MVKEDKVIIKSTKLTQVPSRICWTTAPHLALEPYDISATTGVRVPVTGVCVFDVPAIYGVGVPAEVSVGVGEITPEKARQLFLSDEF